MMLLITLDISYFTLNIMFPEYMHCFASLKLVTLNAKTTSKDLSIWCDSKKKKNKQGKQSTYSGNIMKTSKTLFMLNSKTLVARFFTIRLSHNSTFSSAKRVIELSKINQQIYGSGVFRSLCAGSLCFLIVKSPQAPWNYFYRAAGLDLKQTFAFDTN